MTEGQSLTSIEWQVGQLSQFLELANEARSQDSIDWNQLQLLHDGLLEMEGVVLRILHHNGLEVDAVIDPEGYNGFEIARAPVLALLGQLRRSEELAQHLDPQGPSLEARRFHRLVWQPVAGLWADGHYGSAVQRAATFVNAHVQDVVGRHDVSDRALMQEVFSERAPGEGRARLRWPGSPDDLAVKSMNDGLRYLSMGTFAAVRNPATHRVEEMPELIAIEHLAMMSALMRMIDGCELLTV